MDSSSWTRLHGPTKPPGPGPTSLDTVRQQKSSRSGAHRGRLAGDRRCAGTVPGRGTAWFDAELFRIQGEIFLQRTISNQERAEERFQEAIALARQQGARTLELRATISLARLWEQGGKRTAARNQLEDVYRVFPRQSKGWISASRGDSSTLGQKLEDDVAQSVLNLVEKVGARPAGLEAATPRLPWRFISMLKPQLSALNLFELRGISDIRRRSLAAAA